MVSKYQLWLELSDFPLALSFLFHTALKLLSTLRMFWGLGSATKRLVRLTGDGALTSVDASHFSPQQIHGLLYRVELPSILDAVEFLSPSVITNKI